MPSVCGPTIHPSDHHMAAWFKLAKSTAAEHGYPDGWWRSCLVCGLYQNTWIDPKTPDHRDGDWVR